jgi:ADP-ribose pyrophosphatase YjhB (NUDIX family)
MKKGVDYTAVAVCNLCHDGKGNYVLGLRSDACRDEHFTWEPTGSGALAFGELLEDAVRREIAEELGATVKSIEVLGTHEALRESNGATSHWVYIVHRVEVDRNEVRIMEPEKCLDLQWYKKDSFPTPLMSQFPPILKKFYDKL